MSQKKIEEALNKILGKKEEIVEEKTSISIDGFDISAGQTVTVGGVTGTIQKIGGDVVFINSNEGGSILEIDIPTVLAALRSVSESAEPVNTTMNQDELKNLSQSGAEYYNSKHGTSFTPSDVEQYFTQPNSQGEANINSHLQSINADDTHPEFGPTNFGIPKEKFRQAIHHTTVFESAEEKEKTDEVSDEPAVKIDNPIDPDLENDDVDDQGQSKKVEEETLKESSKPSDVHDFLKSEFEDHPTESHWADPSKISVSPADEEEYGAGAWLVDHKPTNKRLTVFLGGHDDEHGQGAMADYEEGEIPDEHHHVENTDISKLFQGDTLSEEMKLKLETIFKAAVAEATETRVAAEIARLNEEFTSKEKALVEKLESASDEDTQKLTEKIDEYFDALSEQWMQDNELALEARIKSELTEQFINEMQGVFSRNYIDLPVEKFDIVNDLQEKLIEAENKLISIQESTKTLSEDFAKAKRELILDETTKGMTELDTGKFRTMMEEFEFESEDQFKKRSEIIKESFFGGKKTSNLSEKKETKIDVSSKALNEGVEIQEVNDDNMSKYTTFLSKTVKKQY